jgi:SAM-dependent methyltransferase
MEKSSSTLDSTGSSKLTPQQLEAYLPLLPIPHQDWQRRYNQTMNGNPWLQRKLARTRRLWDHYNYLKCNWNFSLDYYTNSSLVIDIGPGAGELLELARLQGYATLGVETMEGEGGMGQDYLYACRLLHQRQRINCLYQDNTINWIKGHPLHNCCSLINLRGCIEQLLCYHMQGPPHHEHHDCKRLRWIISGGLINDIKSILQFASTALIPSGVLLIHANGAANFHEWYRLVMCKIIEDMRREKLIFKPHQEEDDPRLFKWNKGS